MSGRIKRLELDADDRLVLRWALLAYRASLQERAGTAEELRERADVIRRVEDLVQRLS